MRQIKVLQDELDAKTNEILTMRREKTSKVLDLQADLSEKIEEVVRFDQFSCNRTQPRFSYSS